MTRKKPAPKKTRKGRPSLYTEALAAKICARLAEGETLRAICRDKAMPDKATVLRWLADKAKIDFRDQYVRAREMQADALFDEALVRAIGSRIRTEGSYWITNMSAALAFAWTPANGRPASWPRRGMATSSSILFGTVRTRAGETSRRAVRRSP